VGSQCHAPLHLPPWKFTSQQRNRLS